MKTFNSNVFKSFPILKTGRLTLRSIEPQDHKSIFQMRSNNRVNQFIPRPTMQTEIQGKELVNRTIQAFENNQAIGWSAVLRENNVCIGTCGFNMIEPINCHAEIGGEMDTRYWGKGIAQEAFIEIIRFGLEQMNLVTIEAKVAPENRGAVHILEHTGFVKEAHYKNRIFHNEQFCDMAVYTLHAGNERLPF